MRPFSIVVATTPSGGIGKDGNLPWKLPGDMQYFKRVTTNTRDTNKKNAVIMGRKTWDSIPDKFRPLPDRLNVVLSRNRTTFAEGVLHCANLPSALEMLSTPEMQHSIESVFVIGGAEVYKEAISHPSCDKIYLTRVASTFECDTFFPSLDNSIFTASRASQTQVDNGIAYDYVVYSRGEEQLPLSELPFKQFNAEYQYLDAIKHIIEEGNKKGDRTGTGTISEFGTTMRFCLRKSFPLLTTKRVFWRGVAEELLWFVKGDTNGKHLLEKKITIWEKNGSRQYLDSIGLRDREEHDLGPVYGFQWRHFGAKYVDMHTDYTGQGYDQLQHVINTIKTNPDDRRMILSAWNPADLHLMALPPCHMFAQFYVANGELSCQMYQRSCDMGLGVPFNIASYALLTCMMAQVTGLRPGDFIHVLGDAHVYSNHVDPLLEQLKREPKPFPVLKINPTVTDIDGFTFEDFELQHYSPHAKIAMDMAV